MKSLSSAVIVAVLAGSCFGQSTTTSADDPSVARAEKLLLESGKAYAAVKAMEDAVRYEVRMKGAGDQVVDQGEFAFAFGAGSDARMTLPDPQGDLTFTAVDGNVFVAANDKKYMKVELVENIVRTMKGISPQFEQLPIPQMALRYTKDKDALVKGLGLGMTDEPVIAGFEVVEKDGKSFDAVNVTGEGVKIQYRFDQKTRLLSSATLAMSMGDDGIDVMLKFDPKVYDELPTPIAFEVGERKQVDSIDALYVMAAAGDPLPSVTLQSLDGAPVNLDDYKGSVLVLDFWATWCGPCIRGLPEVDKLAKWAASEDLPVKIVAVNIWERVPDEKRTEHVKGFWEGRDLSFPTVIDPDNALAAAFGFNSIPRGVIVGPDGIIRKMHVGYTQFETLKEEVSEILGDAG